jgi:hypothetical protein
MHMATQQHQQQDLQPGQQHLAHLQQEASATPAVLIHQHQQALVVVQDLERHRLDQQLWQDLAASQHQYNHNNHYYKEN